MKLLINILGVALLGAAALNVQAQECAPMTKEAFVANLIEIKLESSRKACESRFADFKESYENLYPKWKQATSKHLEIVQCHTEKIPADIRKVFSEVHENGNKTILKISEQDAKNWCDSRLQDLRISPKE